MSRRLSVGLAIATVGLLFLGCELFEEPGTFEIGADGGTILFNHPTNSSVSVELEIPPGSVPDGTVIEISVADAGDYPANDDLLPSTALRFQPDGLEFSVPASLTITYDPSELGANAEDGLALHTVDGGNWSEATSTVDEAGNSVSASIDGFSLWALIWRLLCTGTSQGSSSSPIELTGGFGHSGLTVGTCSDSFYRGNLAVAPIYATLANLTGDVDLYIYNTPDFSGTPGCSSTNSGTTEEYCEDLSVYAVPYIRVVNRTNSEVTFSLIISDME